MKSTPKPANEKTRALLAKLRAIAERGTPGEQAVAREKIARLERRVSFPELSEAEACPLFCGNFRRASESRRIIQFPPEEMDLANSVKWAIEAATRIPCLHRNGELVAEVTPPTARRLGEIAGYIANSFRALIHRFNALAGVGAADRQAFIMGLYDGMMNDPRKPGESLPKAPRRKRSPGGKRSAAAGLHIHPYSVAFGLGKQIRVQTPVEQLAVGFDQATQPPAGDAPAAV